MKGVLRRGVSALCALFLVLGTAACQQKEPKMKDGKILLTVCMESSVGEGNYHGELHSVYCPVLYGVCQP